MMKETERVTDRYNVGRDRQRQKDTETHLETERGESGDIMQRETERHRQSERRERHSERESDIQKERQVK